MATPSTVRMKRPNFEVPSDSPDPLGYISTAQVSRALGVSVTTVKRWVDDGVLPAHKTPGGHRKLLLQDVLRLIRDGKLPQANMSTLMPMGTETKLDLQAIQVQLDEAIRANDSGQIRSLILGGYQSGHSIEVLADVVIAPTLRRIGHDWERDIISVMHEHRISQAFVSALYQLTAHLRGHVEPNRPVALGGSPEFDHYILPTLLAKMTLLDTGWNAINVGPNTPFSAFVTAMDELKPQLIWLSVSHLADPDLFTEQYRTFYKIAESRGIPVALGGQALNLELRSKLPYTTFGDGCVQLAAFAKMLHVQPKMPKRGRPLGKAKKPDTGSN